MEEWEEYEQRIFEKLHKEFPDCEIKKNDSIKGQFSGSQRQVDVSIRGPFAGITILGIVECKYFNKNVDVPVIDSFIGFLEDVKANVGIIITNKGFSEGAKNRAEVKGIKLDIVEFVNLDKYELVWDKCLVCDPGSDRPPASIIWDYPHDLDGNPTDSNIIMGNCDWCNTLHVKCLECDEIMPITEHLYDTILECDGGCGLTFRIVHEHIEKNDYRDYIEIIEPN